MVLIRETYKTYFNQLKLDRYVLADFIPSKHHETATFVCKYIPFVVEAKSSENDQTEWIAVSISDTNIINIYHPPPAALNISQFLSVTSHFIFSGDLDCCHENLVHPDLNLNGDHLADWYLHNKPHTLFDSKEPSIVPFWQVEQRY